MNYPTLQSQPPIATMRFITTGVENVKDALSWWVERQKSFPCLSSMAHDYLSILSVCPLLCLLHLSILNQLQQLMLRESSAKAALSSHMSEIASHSSQPVHCSVLRVGVCLI